jgi:putative IMPACT (imprinted ancient) family translation regulator
LFFQEINKLHSQASHNCPAYILGKKGETTFCSDNQEPSGTAGKPILNMLQRHNLTNVAIVVTRYYGGVKLGVRGLIEAYGGVAEKTILTGEKTPVIDYVNYICTMPYDFYNIFSHKIKIPDVVVLSTEYTDKIEVVLQTTEYTEKELLIVLSEMGNNRLFVYGRVKL